MNDFQVGGWVIQEQELVMSLPSSVIGLSFPAEDILRLRFNPGDVLKSEETFVVLEVPPGKAFKLKEANNSIVLSTNAIQVEVGLKPFSIRIFQVDGDLVLETPISRTLEIKESASLVRFSLEPDEKIYGLGQDPMAQLDHRHQERRMWQEWGGLRRSGNAGIPFMISSRNYAILLNSSWAARFAAGRAEVVEPVPEFARDWAPSPWGYISSGETHPDELSILLDHGIMDLFIPIRNNVESLIHAYSELTGSALMPPKWALGFIQCKNRYRTQEELVHIGQEYRQRGIPCDVLVIDWLWFKEFGDLEWLSATFPDPQAAFRQLEKMGFHVMQAQHPFIEVNSQKYHEFKEKGYLNKTPEGTRPTYDHSNPEAREAWWQAIRHLYKDGIRGYWTDMGELEVHPEGTEHYLGPRERVHNIYSLLWTMGLYEGQRRDFAKRVFSLPRTAFAGIQRCGAAMWSNDISSTWDVLKDQVVIGQGVCLSGQQYWCTDIGGFFYDREFSPELFIRWFEWGTFCPIFRTHGTRPDNEAWSYGLEAEQIIAGYIRLRSRLMPYIYSLAHQVTQTGSPIMRAMCIDFADDPVAVAQEHQYMFGPAILVAPVLEKGARTKRVYLPTGDWYDFWTDQKYTGRRWIDVPASLARLPLFVRAGSIIPMGPVLQYADEKPLDKVDVHIYPGDKGVFELYEDDGLTYEYENGKFAITRLSIEPSGELVTSFVQGEESLIPVNRVYTPVIHVAHPPEPFVEVDADWSGNGSCTIHALIQNTGAPVTVKAELFPPDGWRIIDGAAAQKVQVNEITHLKWELIPSAEALPVIHRADVEFEISEDEATQQFTRCLQWGSGWASRWQLIGHFGNEDGKGLDRPTIIEDEPDRATYTIDNNELSWCRYLDGEYNPFGYVDFKSPALKDPGTSGVAYAKSRVWSEADISGYMEVSGEAGMKIWVNSEEIFANPEITLKQILPNAISLKKGWNQLLVKSAFNFAKPWSGREYGFTLRFVDGQGKVMENLKYSPS